MKYWLEEKAKKKGGIVAPTPGDAGYDIRAYQDFIVPGKHRVIMPTGIHLAVPRGFVGIIKDRSSLASVGIFIHGGVIDSRFRGEIGIIFENVLSSDYIFVAGERIAQLIVVGVYTSGIENVENLSELGITNRTSGFGSTGKM